MSAGPITRLYYLVNKTTDDLIDVAINLSLGDGGLTFHCEPGARVGIVFSSEELATFFKLAYSGVGGWMEDQLFAPEVEQADIIETLERHQLRRSAEIVEMARVSLPCEQEHAKLLAALEADASAAISVLIS